MHVVVYRDLDMGELLSGVFYNCFCLSGSDIGL